MNFDAGKIRRISPVRTESRLKIERGFTWPGDLRSQGKQDLPRPDVAFPRRNAKLSRHRSSYRTSTCAPRRVRAAIISVITRRSLPRAAPRAAI